MLRIDEFLPEFDVVERHWTLVDASPEVAYVAARNLDLSRSLITRALFGVRSLPRLVMGKGRPPPTVDLEAFQRYGFVILSEEPPAELVLGVVGRFWTPTGSIEPITPDAFVGFDRPGFAKGAMTLSVQPASGSSVVATETRVLCLDDASRRSFRRYWRAIGPFSAYLRRIMLTEVKRSAEGAVADG